MYIPPKIVVVPLRPMALYPPALVFKLSVYSTLTHAGIVVLFVKDPTGALPATTVLYVSPIDPDVCVASVVDHRTTVLRMEVGAIVCKVVNVLALYAICAVADPDIVIPVMEDTVKEDRFIEVALILLVTMVDAIREDPVNVEN